MSVPSAVEAATPPRDRGARRLRIAGSALAVTLLALMTASVVTGFFEQEEVRSYPLDPGLRAASVATDIGDIQVRVAAAGEQPRLITTSRWSYQPPVVAVTGSAERPVIETRCAATAGPGCTVELLVVVPAATELQLTSNHGEIRTNRISGPITASTATGKVRLADLGSGPILVTTESGDITCSAVAPEAQITARSNIGSVTLDFSAPPSSVTGATEMGDVEILVPPGTDYQVWADSDLGEERVTVSSDSGSTRNLTATTSTGDVTIATVGD